MCGIAGIISNNPREISQTRLQAMTNSIAHRGPDGEAHWIDRAGLVGFGHRRLAIIDLSPQGTQPMHYLSRYTIVYNGEIYNYLELREILQAAGYRFVSASDTEVILAAYDHWQQECLQQFDGMFAFAIWDEKKQQLFAARDRLGEKPFFYHQQQSTLLFASEMKALWAAGLDKRLNERMLFNFITIGYTQHPRHPQETAYSNIQKLPAAAYFLFEPGKGLPIQPVNYWKVNKDQPAMAIKDTDAIDQFTALFTDAVKKRLRSDVQVGTSLSGGLDSSSIAVTIKTLVPQQDLQTFSAVFPGFASDESSHIQRLLNNSTIKNWTVEPTASDFVSDFQKLCFHQEGLFASASVYAQYRVFQLAREHDTTVLLDGQGADEILAGYHKYFHWYWQQLYRQNPSLLRKELAGAKAIHISDHWGIKNKLSGLLPLLANRYARQSKQQVQRQTGGLTREFIAANGISYYELPLQNSLQHVLHYNSFQNGLEELLQYADRNSMAHGREVRLPFLQHQLVEFIFSLPANFKIRDGRTKWILRKSMESLLPAAITWRTDKVGFEPPQQSWMQAGPAQDLLQAAKQDLVQRGILQKNVLHKKNQPLASHAADNFDWRYLVASMAY